ncbi:unnamed protein product [Rotaria magnacalcarata]|uniref:Rho guanine nucleotide exchange factor n=2 Tax=Rotaria magnacalcarata TaxID=392030 RepID=A0A815RVS1_9BILA|nr:unnamed protein product [Rotaria magnacalcarata]
MATAISVRIPAGKLGTVRVDRTIDVYPASIINDNDNDNFNSNSATSCIPTLASHRQLTKTTVTATPIPLVIGHSEQEQQQQLHSFVPITKWVDHTIGNNNNKKNNLDDEQMSDIAVIYSLVRHASNRRTSSLTSSPKIIVSPISVNTNNINNVNSNSISRSLINKNYTLEAPLTPVVTHTSKQAQIKTLSSTRTIAASFTPTSASAPTSSQSYLYASLTPPLVPSSVRIQASTSFTSHDRPTVPSIAIKPRPYSFRALNHTSHEIKKIQTNNTNDNNNTTTNSNNNTSQTIRPRRSFRTAPRNAIERQISNITGRVSQLHDSFLARLSDLTSSTSNRQRNRSLTSLNSQTVNTINLTENDLRLTQTSTITRQQRRLVKPRPKSETYDDHHRVNAAGSYAQLTLLGQPKVNSISTQKVIPTDNQNGRVSFRTNNNQTISVPERSNSTTSTHSLSTTVDIKKVKENYDRIFKQLEKSKADLERQRAKGPNHNPAKVAFIENQTRQYEQQLNELKRRLDHVESSVDVSPVKSSFNVENLSNQTNLSVESFSRTSILSDGTIDNKKHSLLSESTISQLMTASVPTAPSSAVSSPIQHLRRKLNPGRSEFHDLTKDTTDNDDEVTEIQSKTSISSFEDIRLFINKSNWAPLSVFLHFLLTDSNSDPNYLLFYILTEELRPKKAENRSELVRWIFEIHSTFTMNGSPLYIGLPQSQTDSINRCLEAQQQDPNDDIKLIFNDAKDFARSIISDRQLSDFNHKRTLGVYRDIDFPLTTKQSHFIEELFRSKFESYYKANTDDWNSIRNSKDLALICSLATFLKRCDIKKCGNIPLEKIPKFLDREQRRLLSKLPRAPQTKRVKDHQLNEHQFSIQTSCKVCSKPVWGINYQGYLCGYCQQSFHRECCSLISEKCSKDRKTNSINNPIQMKPRKTPKNTSKSSSRSLSESFSADNLIQPLFGGIPFSCTQQHMQQQVVSPQRVFIRRSVGGSSTSFNGTMMTYNGPTRTSSLNDGREGSIPNENYENASSTNEGNDAISANLLSIQEQNKNSNLGRRFSDRQVAPHRPASKHRSSSNPQMGGNTIDELLSRGDSEVAIQQQQDSINQKSNSFDTPTISESANQQTTTYGDSDLEADVNTLPNLSDFIPNDVLQLLYQSREWKLQTTINELIHTERTHLKGLKIMKKCFREPMERFPGMSPVELDCIFRNLDQLIDLHTQFKYALRQHREEAKDHVVRHIGDLILRFLDGDKGEQFARACAYFIEDQSQALKLIKKKEQSADFAALMRVCEANTLCRRLTLKDYLPSVMTRFTKLKMLFEAMKKFVSDDEIESEKLSKCVDCADSILKRMNYARLKKEQEALLKQIKSNLEIQIPNDDKSINLQNLHDCLEVTNNRLIYSGTLKLLPDTTTQKTEFECCLFTDIFVFFQKIPIQPTEQRGIDEPYRYVLKEHQRDANIGRHTRPRAAVPGARYTATQNFILTPVIRLEHLLIKKKACGGARSFYVIDTDKKQLIEVEANSKDDLEKWLEWIEKGRKPFEKSKSLTSSASEKSLSPSLTSQSTVSLQPSKSTTRSAIIEEQENIQLVEPNQVKIIEKQTLIEDTPDSLFNAILEKDKELKRLLYEKEMLLSRLLNIPESKINDTPGNIASVHKMKPNSSLEAITNAASYHNQLVQAVSQRQNRAAEEKKISAIEVQSFWAPLTQLGEQLTLALKLTNQQKIDEPQIREYRVRISDTENSVLRRNSNSTSTINITPSMLSGTSQTYSDLKDSISMSSLHSSESLGSVTIPSQAQTFHDVVQFERRSPLVSEQLSSITDLDETIKSPPLKSKLQQLHMATEVIERYDEGVFDDGNTSPTEEDENNSATVGDSDDEDEIEHFDSTDSIIASVDTAQQQSNDYLLQTDNVQTNLDNSTEAQTVNLDMYEEEVYDNVKSNDSSMNNVNDKPGIRNVSDA